MSGLEISSRRSNSRRNNSRRSNSRRSDASCSLPINLTLVLCALFTTTSVARSESTPTNVLFVAIDDLRPALGCYGDPVAKTPNIDHLATRGVVFERAYCQQAVCSPSRLSVMTGLRPDTIRVWDLSTHFRRAVPNAITLPQHFQHHGYHTQSIGKIYHGGGEPSRDPPSWSVEPQFDHVRDPNLRYASPENLAGKGLKRNSFESAEVDDQHYVDGKVCQAAIDALRKLKDEPFFLAVGFRKPHLPFCAPEKYWNLYDPARIPLPTVRDHPTDAPELATRSWRELEGYRDIPSKPSGRTNWLADEKVRQLRHGYYACVSYVDALVGRLLKTLDECGLANNTVVVLWGDHGYHLGEQGLWTKANNYELSTRVPLIIAAPHAAAGGGRSSALVEMVDLYPTLVELCGLPLNTEHSVRLEGISLTPLIHDPARNWKQAAFSQYPRARQSHRHQANGDIMGYAVRTAQHRYVEWRDNATQRILARELYEIDADACETTNVAGNKDREATVQRLAEILKAGWRAALPAGERDK